MSAKPTWTHRVGLGIYDACLIFISHAVYIHLFFLPTYRMDFAMLSLRPTP